jgi:hypothetical protein
MQQQQQQQQQQQRNGGAMKGSRNRAHVINYK